MAATSESASYFRLHTLGEKFDGSCCRGVEMEDEVWQHMPNDLFSRILLLLPSRSIVRFRALSKCWRVLLTSRDFLKQHAALRKTARMPVCGIKYRRSRSKPPEVAPEACDCGKQVVKVDLCFLPPWFQDCAGFAAHDGLVCVWKRIPNPFIRMKNWFWSFCLFNPLTGHYKVLPPRSNNGHEHESSKETFKVFMAVTEPGDGTFPAQFIVLVVSAPGKGGSAVLYSSVTNEWDCVWEDFAQPTEEQLLHFPFPQYLPTGTRLLAAYGTLQPCFEYQIDNEGLVCAEHESEPGTANNEHSPYLVMYGGHLYSVQEDQCYVENKLELTVWKLEGDSWRRVGSAPSSILKRFLNQNKNEETCDYVQFSHHVSGTLVVGDAIYIVLAVVKTEVGTVTVDNPDPNTYKTFATHVVRYNVLKRTWGVVEQQLHQKCIGNYVLFVPRF